MDTPKLIGMSSARVTGSAFSKISGYAGMETGLTMGDSSVHRDAVIFLVERKS